MWTSIEILTVLLIVLNQFVNVSDKQMRCHTIHGIHVMLLGCCSLSWVVSHYIVLPVFLVTVRVGDWFKKTALNIDHRTMYVVYVLITLTGKSMQHIWDMQQCHHCKVVRL